MAKKKQIISAKVPTDQIYFNLYNLEGSVDSIVDGLRETEKKVEALGYTNVRITIWNHYDETVVELYGDREETDQEYKTRLENEKLNRQRREQAKAAEELKNSPEYEEYLKLKEKFG